MIYETKLRTAHQAGRLAQMRDPDVVTARPFWQYIHGETREPKPPRAEHLALDGKVWRHDDPIWQRIYPPNGWRCSCGVRRVSKAGQRRLGKDGPDPITGDLVEGPEGIAYGWGYQPGDTWERGLVPRELQQPLSLAQPELPLPVSPPLTELGRPVAAPELPDGKPAEYYVERFLQRFGADIRKGAMYRDKAGHAIVISDQLFRDGAGRWKVKKLGRHLQIERLAEAIFDPDEIWVDWVNHGDGIARLTRRFLRWDPQAAVYSSFEWTSVGWSGKTAFDPRTKKGAPRLSYLEDHRRGALLFRRGK